MAETDKTPKGLESLIEAIAVGLREKRDFPGRWCEHFTEGCIERMRQYGETGVLCEHKCEYCKSFKWAVDQAKHYEEKTDIPYLEVLKSWEENRSYWFLNYYQECNQPKIKDGQVRVFDTKDVFFGSLADKGFRCPSCGAISKDPYKCSCGWCSYGLLGTMGKGVTVLVKDGIIMSHIFMPIAWEEAK